MRENKLRFSIRKLTIGAVSVMFGAVIFSLSANQVKAATNEIDGTQVTKISDTSNKSSESTKTLTSESDITKTQNDNSNEKVTNDDASTKEAQKTPQVDEAHQTPQAGENYNKDYQDNVPSVILPKNDTQSPESTTNKAANGVTTQVTISSTNKNNGQTSSAKAENKVNTVFVDVATASNTEATFTINNPADSSKNVSIFTEFPAFNGTKVLSEVDPNRIQKDANGNIAFGGDYAKKA